MTRQRLLAGLRFDRKLGEFTARCWACEAAGHSMVYWPITTEFWDPWRPSMCRACYRRLDAKRARERYRANPKPKILRNAKYERDNRDVRNLKRRERRAA